MFRFTAKPPSGSHKYYLKVYPHTVHSTHASHVIICSHNTDNVLYELYVSTLNQVCNFSKILTVAH